MLQINNLHYQLNGKMILKNINMHFKKNKFIGILGPNGAGKSTLLKHIYGSIKPSGGEILFENQNLAFFSKKQRAQKIAVLAQEEHFLLDFSVEQIVEMGRFAYKKTFENYSLKDKQIVLKMLEKVEATKYLNREFQSLSGGEKQRILIARALVQEPSLLILDEPTNHLDVGYQLRLLNLIKHLNITIIVALHDLNIAALFCDEIFILKDGKNVLCGTPEEVLTPQNLKDIFDINCLINKNPHTHQVQISYINDHYHINGQGFDHSHNDHFTGSHNH